MREPSMRWWGNVAKSNNQCGLSHLELGSEGFWHGNPGMKRACPAFLWSDFSGFMDIKWAVHGSCALTVSHQKMCTTEATSIWNILSNTSACEKNSNMGDNYSCKLYSSISISPIDFKKKGFMDMIGYVLFWNTRPDIFVYSVHVHSESLFIFCVDARCCDINGASRVFSNSLPNLGRLREKHLHDGEGHGQRNHLIFSLSRALAPNFFEFVLQRFRDAADVLWKCSVNFNWVQPNYDCYG